MAGGLRESVLIHIADCLHLGSTYAEGRARSGIVDYARHRIALTSTPIPLLVDRGERSGKKIWRLTAAGHAAATAIRDEARSQLRERRA